eukprot:TRINITY_DN1223_c0_g1_i1.p1 TRINITY_DN1223_c0_g1~~TRINITY_DN1223_c0_g1_i1.p1  ORF type:complete len:367 (+),score=91.09 TRINITY_DN1223_c0_g1_i1:109-1209(+)
MSKKPTSSGSSSSSSKKSLAQNYPELDEKRRLVIATNEAPTNTRNLYYSGAYKEAGYDNSFSLSDFKEDFKINMISCDAERLVFDMIGVDAPIANALRRILIAEVPTMAIEKVYIYNNTSIMQDEVLAHRIGLVPIKADPRKFNFKDKTKPEAFTPEDTIVFKLHVKCTKNPDPKDDTPEEKYINHSVYSKDLVWVPQEDQASQFGEIAPVDGSILLMRLRPGQEIHLEAYCEKGEGRDHAKFSPVCTASYRLLPEINFKDDVKGAEAEELVQVCPMKVFDIEDLGKGQTRAVVARPRNCTMCRECIRPAKFNEKIQLARVKNHFIFSIESTGALPPRELFRESIKLLMKKCETIEQHLDRLAMTE